jgi:hypothetical protein
MPFSPKYVFLCRQDRAKAVDILVKDLKVFSSFNEELYKEITQLLTLENFRLESVPAYCLFKLDQLLLFMGRYYLELSCYI